MRKKQKINKFVLLLAVVMPFAIVFTQVKVTKINDELNDLNYKIAEQEKINDSLEMLAYELGSKDHLINIAKTNGMEITNKSVKVND